MATMKNIDIPSTTAGLTWRVDCYKPYDKRQPPVAVATEGVKGDGFFTQTLCIGTGGGSRRIKHPVPGGRMTEAAISQAVNALIKDMRAQGLIA